MRGLRREREITAVPEGKTNYGRHVLSPAMDKLPIWKEHPSEGKAS